MGFVVGRFRRAVCLVLVVALLLTVAPVAPVVLADVASGWRAEAFFWFHASGWAKTFGRLFSAQDEDTERKSQERQEERDARVRRVQIHPGDVTVRVYERAFLTAVAYDAEGNPVGGVKFNWSAQDADRNDRAVRVSQTGEFESRIAGSFKVTVEADGRRDHIRVTVLDGERRRSDERPWKIETVSTLDPPTDFASVSGPKSRARRRARSSGGAQFVKASLSLSASTASAPAAAAQAGCGDEYRWNRCNYQWGDDPSNRRGRRPGRPEDQGAGNGNFQIAAPVLALAGRGIDLSLNLVYNSDVWSKNGSKINYDIDQDCPAAGWSIGFGRIVGLGVDKGAMIIEPDGTRHGFKGSISQYSWGSNSTLYTTDGTFIDYTATVDNNGVPTYAHGRYPNGTQIQYGAQGGGAIYPTRIKDVNGNYVSVTYVNNAGPKIQTVTDTLGRVVNFHYDANGLLTAVTGPGLGGGTRTLVRLKYRELPALSTGFGSLVPMTRDNTPWAVEAIYYPATGTGYWFGDADSYISYGIIAKVVEQRAMGFSAASLSEQGTVTQGTMTQQQVYNFVLTGLTDAPTFNSMTETFDGMNTAAAVTQYEVYRDSTPRKVTVRLPNGTKSVQYSYNAPNSYLDGLAYRDEIRDVNDTIRQSTDVVWQQGAYDSPRPVSITVTDERGQTTGAEFSYGPAHNQVTEARSYDYGYAYGGASNTLLRKALTQYHTAAGYTSNHVFSLPTVVEIYDGGGGRMSRVEYEYDGATPPSVPSGASLQNLPTSVVQHDPAYNPFTGEVEHCYWTQVENCSNPVMGCYYEWVYVCEMQNPYMPGTDYRGLVTKVKSYADAVNLTGAITETARYDITGNRVTASTSCCAQVTTAYTQSTQYAYPEAQTRGSATDGFAQVKISGTFDFNTGLVLTNRDENNRPTSAAYDANSLRITQATLPTGARTTYAYDDAAMKITQITYLAASPVDTGAVASHTVKYLNGMGQVKQERAAGVNIWDIVDIQYDQMGRVWKQTRPYRNGETQRWTTFTYDALSREAAVEAPDASKVEIFINEPTRPSAATTAPGQTARIRDAWGRERWGRIDASGRLVEVVEPNPDGDGSVASGGLRTTYTYDALGRLTGTNQGGQTRAFVYDSVGRLVRQKLAETGATLNNAGAYVGVGTSGAQWSDFFVYDERSNLVQRVDARGVKTNLNYGNDPLNRLQSVSYDLTGPRENLPNSPVGAASSITYAYRAKANPSDVIDVTQAASNTTTSAAETYSYDSEGRIFAKVLNVNGRPNMRTSYVYDSLGRTKDMLYPAQNLPAQTSRKTVHADYDVASRLSRLQVDGQDHASAATYNAASQLTSLQIGWAGGVTKREEYDYDPTTGLLTAQRVLRDGITPILNLQYNYLRPGTSAGRTGQLTSVTDLLDRNKERAFEYDALGRLRRATGGQNVNWAQRYDFDRYGNRLGVYSKSVERFVRDFYQGALNRQPSAAELQTWKGNLQTAYGQGQTQLLTQARALGDALFNSAEYAARGRNDSEFVYDLYKAYLQREPDQAGWNFWTGQVPSSGRAGVRNAFATSGEFGLVVQGLSPNAPPNGLAVPPDGARLLTYDQATNRVSTAGYEYDAAGNQTRAQTAGGGWQRYEYDAAGRLAKVKTDAGVVLASYTYGAGNRRLVTESGGVRTYYVWEGDAVIMEYQETALSPTTPQWTKSYFYMDGRLLSTAAPNGAGGEAVQFHHPDRLGTRLVSNATDTGRFEQNTLPFGTALDAESTGATNRRFTSYDRDPMTGLDNAVNRHYDSAQGRFTQVDPLGAAASRLSNPQTLNLYAYCANDPVNRVDPDGMLFGFLGKIFKGLGRVFGAIFKGIGRLIAKVLTVVGKVALKLLSSKLGRVALSIALVMFLGPGAPLALSFLAVEAPTIGMTATMAGLIGIQVAGAVAKHLQKGKNDKPARPKEVTGGTEYQRELLEAALADFLKRVAENKDCADFLGGKEKVLKAIRESKVEFKDLGQAAPWFDPRTKQIIGIIVLRDAEVDGKTIRINTNGTYSEGGKMITLGGHELDLERIHGGHEGIVREASSTIAHETGHRTGALPDDRDDPEQSQTNDKAVKKVCY